MFETSFYQGWGGWDQRGRGRWGNSSWQSGGTCCVQWRCRRAGCRPARRGRRPGRRRWRGWGWPAPPSAGGPGLPGGGSLRRVAQKVKNTCLQAELKLDRIGQVWRGIACMSLCRIVFIGEDIIFLPQILEQNSQILNGWFGWRVVLWNQVDCTIEKSFPKHTRFRRLFITLHHIELDLYRVWKSGCIVREYIVNLVSGHILLNISNQTFLDIVYYWLSPFDHLLIRTRICSNWSLLFKCFRVLLC